MNFLFRFLLFFCFFLLTEAGHTKAHGHQHVTTHASLPYQKGKVVSDIEISSNETNEEDEDERNALTTSHFLSIFFSTQVPGYYSGYNLQYSRCKIIYSTSSRHTLLRVFRI